MLVPFLCYNGKTFNIRELDIKDLFLLSSCCCKKGKENKT